MRQRRCGVGATALWRTGTGGRRCTWRTGTGSRGDGGSGAPAGRPVGAPTVRWSEVAGRRARAEAGRSADLGVDLAGAKEDRGVWVEGSIGMM
jgi:hypothetical protein